MNTLELKGGLIEMIAGINNQEVLQHLYDIVDTITKNNPIPFKKVPDSQHLTQFQTIIEVEFPIDVTDYQTIAEDESNLLNPDNEYHIYTPLNVFGAADILLTELNKDKNKAN